MTSDNDNLDVEWSAWEFAGSRWARHIFVITVDGARYKSDDLGGMYCDDDYNTGRSPAIVTFPNVGRGEWRDPREVAGDLGTVTHYEYNGEPVDGNPDAEVNCAEAILAAVKEYRAAVLRSLFPAIDGGPCAAATSAAEIITGFGFHSKETIGTVDGPKTCRGVAAIIETAFGFHRD